MSFVHLHCHSHYSLLDGAGSIDKLLKRAKELGQPALALTDHGNLYGALEFYQAAAGYGVKPIIGYEAYIAPGSRLQKTGAKSAKEAAFHLTLLAMNLDGYRNLLKLSSLAFIEGFYYHGRIDKEILAQYSDGLICLSGCAGGEIARTILSGEDGVAKATEIAAWFRDLFGDRYYLEIQDTGLAIQRTIMEGKREIAEKLNIPTVATNDVHYIHKTDSEVQDILLCINTGAFRTDEKRMRMEGDQYYLRSKEEMLAVMPQWGDAIDRTLEIADRIDCKLDLGKRYFPVFTPPADTTSDDYLRTLCLAGLKKRYSDNPKRMINGELSEEVMVRLDRELSVISKLGFPNYFLIVWDLVRVAEERGIHRTARGSGVGALVCYALNMSHVCPLEFDLLFERFLDENRREAPDIDIDFDQDRRSEILDYIKEKYGSDNVAQIGTIGTMAAKSSIKDVGRALGYSIPMVSSITTLVPDAPKTTLDSALEKSKNLQQLYETNAEVKEIINFAKQLEGLARSSGTHACAVVIADKPLVNYLPLQIDSKNRGDIVTQWTMGDVEKAGLLKMDFLGLRNLAILAQAIELVKQTTGQTIDPYKFPLDDDKTYELLRRGETKGIFQLEGGGIREMLQRMKPDNFRDIVATLALYRPGPLEGKMTDDYIDIKNGRKQAVFLHPVMETVLGETHGIMVYQEQIMRILNQLGKIPLSNSYSCIKAISKKKQDQIDKYEGEFLQGAQENGIAKEAAVKLFDMIKVFAGYGFNKSHSTAYALVAYMTAYLKAHYPCEFMAALLCGDMSGRNFTNKDSTVEHVEDCERMGMTVVAPDVNHSAAKYRIADGKIYFALEAIKGVRAGFGNLVEKNRNEHGPFKDLFDLCTRIDMAACNRVTIESLIKAGACDSFGAKRSQLMQAVERAIKAGHTQAEDRSRGQKNFFDTPEEDEPSRTATATKSTVDLPDIPEWSTKEKGEYEKEVLGYYISSHPLKEYEAVFDQYRSHRLAAAVLLPNNTNVLVAGSITDIKLAATKNPKPGQPSRYAMFTLEDSQGAIRSIIWPQQYGPHAEMVKSGNIVFAVGRIDRSRSQQEDDPNLIVDELLTIEEASKRFTRGIAITVSESQHGEPTLRSLYEILRGYPGSETLELYLQLADGHRAQLRSAMQLTVTSELHQRVTTLLGKDSIRILKAAIPTSNRFGGNNRRLSET